MYATLTDMTARFETAELIQLTDEALNGVIDEAKLATVLTEATGKINAYISKRYPGPFAPVPSVLTDAACDIARYRLYKTSAPEQVAARYQEVMDWLKMVAEGTATLTGDDGATATQSASVQFSTPDRLFSRDRMRGY